MHLNARDHEKKIKIMGLMHKSLLLKDQSCSELNSDDSARLAHDACAIFNEIHTLLASSPLLEDDLRDHSFMYEMRHFARKWGY